MGIIIVGGENKDSSTIEKRILESRFDGSKFLPWKVMDHELKIGREKHVVIYPSLTVSRPALDICNFSYFMIL